MTAWPDSRRTYVSSIIRLAGKTTPGPVIALNCERLGRRGQANEFRIGFAAWLNARNALRSLSRAAIEGRGPRPCWKGPSVCPRYNPSKGTMKSHVLIAESDRNV